MPTAPRSAVLPPDVQQRVRAEVRADEKLVWVAQPLPRAYRLQSIVMGLFGLVFTGFSLAWVGGTGWAAVHNGTPVLGCFGLFGLIFLGVGLWLLSAPVWLARQAARTAYVLTDRRAVVIAGRVFGGVTVQSFEPARLTGITRLERADGTGDLVFEQFVQRQGTGVTTVRRGFMAIDDVRDVEALIHATLLAGRTRPA